ncbi:hypothetical protein V8G54_010438 [Vigna mungo]|uniref:Uncharacterized protein n=1 Tax=Vigna mungo TaxID=3915 RepID=A0AAQ3NVS5_VIGMU
MEEEWRMEEGLAVVDEKNIPDQQEQQHQCGVLGSGDDGEARTSGMANVKRVKEACAKRGTRARRRFANEADDAVEDAPTAEALAAVPTSATGWTAAVLRVLSMPASPKSLLFLSCCQKTSPSLAIGAIPSSRSPSLTSKMSPVKGEYYTREK